MENLTINLKFVKNLVWAFIAEGIIFILFGVLFIIYPESLAILIAIALIIAGISSIVFAVKLNKYSKFEIKG